MTTPASHRRGLTVRSYRYFGWFAFVSLFVIIVTGALVRLTGSGLGCVDWPACNDQQFVDVSTPHAAIEQLNRFFTGIVAASVIAAVVAAFFVRPRDRRMIRLAALLVLGVVGQVVLGGVVVITGLHPLANMGHFLLSMVLMTWAYWLLVHVTRLHQDSSTAQRGGQQSRVIALSRAVVALMVVVITTGTVVTGTGPHAGDELSPRFDFMISTVARVHSATVMLTVFTAFLLGFCLRRDQASSATRSAFEGFLFLAILQGGIGYLQYFTGVPVVLVAVHIALSVAVWIGALHLANTALHTSWRSTRIPSAVGVAQ